MPLDAVDFHSLNSEAFLASYTKSPQFRERSAIWEKLINRYAKASDTVLDVGCGPGLFAQHAAAKARRVVAIDGSPAMLALARTKDAAGGSGNVSYVEMQIADIPGNIHETFDLVLCSSVLEYLPSLSQGIQMLCDRVRPGGILILSLPNAWSPYRLAERLVFALTGRPAYYRFVKHVITPGNLRSRLAAHNLACVHLEHYSSALGLSREYNRMQPKALFNNMFVMACRKPAGEGHV